METVIAAAVVAVGLAVGLIAAASLLSKRVPGFAAHRGSAPPPVERVASTPAEADDQLERRAAMGRLEERLETRETELERRGAELERFAERLRAKEQELGTAREESVRRLEQLSGISASQAKHLLLNKLEDTTRNDTVPRVGHPQN